MTEDLLALVPQYGPPLVALATFLSCLALPVPSSLLMLTAGAFAAAGDLALADTALLALTGAILGDQTGYLIGTTGSAALWRRLSDGSSAAVALRAAALAERWGGTGVFLSRWLFSPLGPYVNFAAGAAGIGWLRFTLWGAAGETVWVTLYVGLGYGFAANIEALGSLLGNLSGTLAAAAVTIGLGHWLRASLRSGRPGSRVPR